MCFAHIEAIKQIIVGLLVLHEQLEVLEHLQAEHTCGNADSIREQSKTGGNSYPFLHRDFVVVADGVFTQEVKLHHVLLTVDLRVQFDVFHPQRAAAHGVGGLALLLLVTCSQSQLDGTRRTSASGQESRRGRDLREPHLVDEVERHGPLSDPHLLGLPVLAVLVPDAVHALLQPASRLVFLPVLLSLQSHIPDIRTRRGNVSPPLPTRTLILELGFSMMYLMEPWMFSVHDTSHVTLLS